jgi:Na+/H+ antiporter NhaD/arsenite permease-like protein
VWLDVGVIVYTNTESRNAYHFNHMLSSFFLGVLFFLGILLSVGAMDSAGILRSLAEVLDKNIPNDAIVASTYFTSSGLCLFFIFFIFDKE